MNKKQILQMKDFKQLYRNEGTNSNAWHHREEKGFHPYGSNQDSCMLNGSPSLGPRNKSSEKNIDSNRDAEDAAKSGLPELVVSSSSEYSGESADDDDEDAPDERLSLPMNDESGENGLVDSELDDDDDAGPPAPSITRVVYIYYGQVHVESEDDEATEGSAASKATRSRPLSGCKRMFADTRNDSADSDSHDDPGLAESKASLTIGVGSAVDGSASSEARSRKSFSFGAENGKHASTIVYNE